MNRVRAVLRRLWARHELRVALVIVPGSIAVMFAAVHYAAEHGRLDLGLPGMTTIRDQGGQQSPLNSTPSNSSARTMPGWPSHSVPAKSQTAPRGHGTPGAQSSSTSTPTSGITSTSGSATTPSAPSTPPGSGVPNPTTTTSSTVSVTATTTSTTTLPGPPTPAPDPSPTTGAP